MSGTRLGGITYVILGAAAMSSSMLGMTFSIAIIFCEAY